MRITIVLLIALALLAAQQAPCMAQSAPRLTFAGAVNAYYSYSILEPPANVRAYSTQPARNGTIAIDLAMLAAQWQTDRVDLRFAVQAGTWVDANYVLDDEGWKYVREANVQVNLDSVFFVTAGILPSNIGHESSVNAENMLLSRSLNADATPYYMTGAGAIYVPSSSWRFAVYAVNGWQLIVDNNSQLSFASVAEWMPSNATTVSLRSYIGNDDSVGAARLRIHNNAWIDHRFGSTLRAVLMGDVSLLKNRTTDEFDVAWYGGLKGAWQFTDLFRLGGRVEIMSDPKNALFRLGPPVEIVGFSAGLDVIPADNLLVRLEVRSLNAAQAIFPSDDGLQSRDLFGTLAFSATF